MYQTVFKRLLDLLVATTGFLLLLPFFIIITILLYFSNNGKPFFLQERPGKDERIFSVIKFKTMNDAKDNTGKLLPDSQRLTAVGTFIRKTSLDEIPQLLNVVKGDMSIIGPRPLRTYYLPYYSTKEKLRHTVRPGITGLAQVSGRNFIGWEERFAFDIEYVENISLSLDLRIFLLTIRKVISSSDVAVNQDDFIDSFHEHRMKQIANGTFKDE